MKVVFAGTPGFAATSLIALLEAGHEVALVLTQPDRPAGRGLKPQPSAVKQLALERGLALEQPAKLDAAAIAAVDAVHPEVMVVAAYGRLIPPALLALPPRGCVNVHASLLPRWRGAAPIQRALLAGDTQTGITIMQMDAGLDTGPLLAQRAVPIESSATSASLHEVLAQQGAKLLLDVIAALERGTAVPRAQGSEGVSYAHKLEKREAIIDWTADAAAISRQVRGCNPWPIAETRLAGLQIRIWQADAVAVPADGMSKPLDASTPPPGTVLGLRDGRLLVACGAGLLAVDKLQSAGKRTVTAAEFAHGHASAHGHKLDGLKFG